MQHVLRISSRGLFALIAVITLSACGSSNDPSGETEVESSDAVDVSETAESAAPESEEGDSVSAEEPDEDLIVVEATTSTVAENVTPTSIETEQALFVPDPGPGLGAFAIQVFQTGELGLTPEQQGCVDGRRQAELRVDRSVELEALSIEQQALAIEILFDCAGGELEELFLAEFEPTPDMIELGLGPDFGRCIFREVSRDDADQPAVLLAIASVTADQPAPEETVEVGSRTFARCVDIAALLIDSFAADPASAALLDIDCLRDELDEDAAADLFAASLRDPSGENPTNLASGFEAFKPCFRFGALMAEAFSDSVTLNANEISCIDAAFATDEVFESVINGADLPASADAALVGCLEPATLVAMGG